MASLEEEPPSLTPKTKNMTTLKIIRPTSLSAGLQNARIDGMEVGLKRLVDNG